MRPVPGTKHQARKLGFGIGRSEANQVEPSGADEDVPEQIAWNQTLAPISVRGSRKAPRRGCPYGSKHPVS